MTSWQAALLSADHDLSEFDCGVDSLTSWLKGEARRAHQQGSAATHVWAGADHKVVAYYSLCPYQVRREEVSRGQAGGISVVPSYLLARLALDKRLHHQGLGAELLHDALIKIVEVSARGGGRLIVVDAIDERAAGFYQRWGFTPVREQPLKLTMKISTARASLTLG